MKTIKLIPPPPPAKRPKCAYCHRPLAPSFRVVARLTKGAVKDWWEKLEWDGSYRGYGAFDTMRCAVDYANATVARLRGEATYRSTSGRRKAP